MNYRQLAQQVPSCMGCGKARDGTIVLAHRNRNAWGLCAGKGIKTVDICGAFLCYTCHVYGDGEGRRDHDWWELAVHRSLTWAWKSGWITVG
jgi:hypothetical protein